MMTTKNHLKGASFTYAFRRINESINAGFYLEAVTLSESIISDRLLSFVKHHNKSVNVRTTFKQLIDYSKKYSKSKVKNSLDLFGDIDIWRIERNICIHSVSKSEPGTVTIAVEEFIELAKHSAINGKKLARLVCEWNKDEK